MIDTGIYLTKVIFFITAILLVYSFANNGKDDRLSGGLTLFAFCIFATGAEMITANESPWEYLITTGTEQEWGKALFGGSLMLMLPVLIFAFCGKDIAQLTTSKPSANDHERG